MVLWSKLIKYMINDNVGGKNRIFINIMQYLNPIAIVTYRSYSSLTGACILFLKFFCFVFEYMTEFEWK